MPVNIPRLRWWFAALAVVLLAVVAGFYLYGRYRLHTALKRLPEQMGINVQQSTTGFTFSKSQGGRTLFTIHASQAVQYKQGGRAELKDVNIIVYGREGNRYDQIYGSNFEYDPQAGTIAALGEVHIDLEGNAAGPINPDQATPQELKNPIHLMTSGLIFNRNTGIAETRQALEFRVPQASGSAQGAVYDSKAATLTLLSRIHVKVNEPHAADIVARRGVIAAGPARAVLDGVRIEDAAGNLEAGQLTILLRDDNTVERLLASGEVKAHQAGKTSVTASAPRAEAVLGNTNNLQTVAMTGGVQVDSSGTDNVQASAGKVSFLFRAANVLDKIRAEGNVRLLQHPANPGSGRPVEMRAAAMDFAVHNGHLLTEAVTSGPAEIRVLPPSNAAGENPGTTTVTAGQFRARFEKNRLASLVGTPEAKIDISAAGQPDKTSTSDTVEASFSPTGAISRLVQEGHFHYVEPAPGATREAWAEQAVYVGAQSGKDVLQLSGSPRFVDGGMTTTADSMEIGRTTGDAFASGNVKTTFSQLKPQPGGALLATEEPIHVTGTTMAARRNSGTAVYQNARLWQGSNVIEAPTLEFRREPREVVATGTQTHEVTTVFAEQGSNGKVTPVNVTASKLTYTDAARRAHLTGGVTMKGGDTTVTADTLDIYLRSGVGATEGSQSPVAGPSQLEKAVATGHVVIQAPARRATGENLTYVAREGKFQLTGGPPSIFDAERGKITGDSLTFFQHDDKVVIESRTTPTVTRTRVAK